MQSATPRLRALASRFQPVVLVPVLALITLVCWAFASPLGASPDDDFHLTSSWCALGDRDGICEATGEPGARYIPAEVANSAICYAYHPEQSAGCQAGYGGSEPGDLVYANRGNFDGLYPPVFYAVTGLLASPNVEASALAMRVLSATLFVAMSTALFLLLPVRRRVTLVWAWLVSTIPLGVFILASNNPSSWAVISSGTLWLALLGYYESTGRRRIGLGVLAGIATVVGAGARSDAAVYSALAAVIASVLAFERSRRFLIHSILPAAVILVSIVFYFSSAQGAAAVADLPGGIAPTPGATPAPVATDAAASGSGSVSLTLILSNLLNMPLLWAGVFGSWGLGWLDTPMPGVVSVGSLVCFAVVVFAGLRAADLRKKLALALVGVALIAFPSYVLLQAHAVVGGHVQPRYILPLIVILTGVGLLTVGDRGLKLSALQRDVVVVVLIVAHAMALHFTMRRFISGLDVGDWNLNNELEWWWGGLAPMVVWVVAVVAFGAMAVLITRRLAPATGIASPLTLR